MWVYEQNYKGRRKIYRNCYESPCGFMRLPRKSFISVNAWLRIPMWVYETEWVICRQRVPQVTNPHVGL